MAESKATNILYIAHDTGLIGGAERQLLELFRGIDRTCFRPFLVCLEPGGPVAERASEMGVPVHHMLRRWRWDLSVALRLRTFIKRSGIAIVHAYLGLPGFYGAVAAKLAGIKVITTIRIAGPRKRLTDVSERLAFLISDCIVSNSEAGVDYYFRRFPGRHKTLVIYNGYDMSDFDLGIHKPKEQLGLPEHVPLVGHVANLTYLKDYPTFLRAMAAVLGTYSEAVGVVVGDGHKRGEYEDLAKSLGIWDRVMFLGHRRDVLDLVKAFDVCVLASHPEYSEGLSNSIAEYMGMAKPVVATAVGGNSELITDGVTGFLSPAGEPEPLARKIIALLEDPDLRRRMGEQGRKFFEANLTLEQMVSRTQQAYQSLIGA